jgi:hypothetical protein
MSTLVVGMGLEDVDLWLADLFMAAEKRVIEERAVSTELNMWARKRHHWLAELCAATIPVASASNTMKEEEEEGRRRRRRSTTTTTGRHWWWRRRGTAYLRGGCGLVEWLSFFSEKEPKTTDGNCSSSTRKSRLIVSASSFESGSRIYNLNLIQNTSMRGLRLGMIGSDQHQKATDACRTRQDVCLQAHANRSYIVATFCMRNFTLTFCED